MWGPLIREVSFGAIDFESAGHEDIRCQVKSHEYKEDAQYA